MMSAKVVLTRQTSTVVPTDNIITDLAVIPSQPTLVIAPNTIKEFALAVM